MSEPEGEILKKQLTRPDPSGIMRKVSSRNRINNGSDAGFSRRGSVW